MENVTVDINNPTPYIEKDSIFYRFKRKLITMPTLRKIRKILGNKNRIFSLLEIGTGSGFLISFLESEFPNGMLTGLEYDSRLVLLTQNKVKNATILQGNAENFDLNDKKFDIIVSLQVIEHLFQPESMLKCVKKHLNKNGIFIFTTPNLEGIGAKCMKDKWHGFRTDHVSLKSYSDWKALIEKNGFSSIYCGSTFFTGIPIFNRMPLGLLNWGLLFVFGSLRWKHGESFIGVFKLNENKL
jgi:SAM-dependent methyltransferase